MNTGLAEFHAASQPWDIHASHPGVAIQSGAHGLPAQIRVAAADNTTTVIRSLSTPCSTRSAPQSCRTENISTRRPPAASRFIGSGNRQRQRPGAASQTHGHRDQRHSQPQAALGLVLLGVFLVIAVELLGIRSLTFAVGAYLPIGTTLPIFVGGVVRWLVDAP